MYDLQILVNGNPIRKYFDRDGRIWIEAKQDSKFELKANNGSWSRVLAVISVDGLNIINGKHEPLEIAHGYILNSHSSIKIPGWKTGPDSAREFIFTNFKDSYSRKIGANEENIGVIAAAFFEEKWEIKYYYSPCIVYPTYPTYPTYWYSNISTSDSISVYQNKDNISGGSVSGCFVATQELSKQENFEYNSNAQELPDQQESGSIKVAVGSGNDVNYRTYKSYFNKGNVISMITIYYDTWAGLKRRGILHEDKNYKNFPKPFPNNGEYCPNV